MDIAELVRNPRESLAVELKTWIDIDTKAGQEKIIKSCIAMRNNNGGYVLIGFNNTTTQPDSQSHPGNIREKFHIDKIQGAVSRFASEQFEITVHYPTIDDLEYVVIEMPAGIKTPVATKSSLQDNGRTLVKENTVYVRSLNSNNTPSTTEAIWKDWKDLIERCFDNREADIGRFIQRNLTPENLKALGLLVTNAQNAAANSQLEENEMQIFFQESELRYNTVLAARNVTLPPHGLHEVGVIIKGDVPPHRTDRNFLNLIDSTNPRYTGWPVWVDSRNFSDQESRPYVQEGAWEALILSLNSGWSNHVDFWRIFPEGKFFLLRALQDDIGGSNRAPAPLTALDFGLAILRTGEAIAVSLMFAKALGCNPETTQIKFGFKWTHLANRQLASWANPERYLSGGRSARQNEFYTETIIALNASNAAICGHLYDVINQLFNLFDGFEIGYQVVEDLFNRLINRRL